MNTEAREEAYNQGYISGLINGEENPYIGSLDVIRLAFREGRRSGIEVRGKNPQCNEKDTREYKRVRKLEAALRIIRLHLLDSKDMSQTNLRKLKYLISWGL